jgi:hypothetical protein
MRRAARWRTGIVFCLATLAGACLAMPPADKEDPVPAMREYLVERSRSPWRGYTSSYEEEQAGYSVAAAAVGALERIPHLAAYELDGEPFMAVDRAGRRVVLNERFFGPFVRPDLPRLGVGERVDVGTVKDRRILADPLALVGFLIESEVLRTYWHVEARLRLVELAESEDGFQATVRGSHIYFTNDSNEDRYAFRIEVNTRSGAVRAVGVR